MKILRVLFNETNLKFKSRRADTKPFQSNLGSIKGDAVSEPFFTIYFEHYLNIFREEVKNIPINIYNMNSNG